MRCNIDDFTNFFEQTEAQLQEARLDERSAEYREGYHYGLAYVKAGKVWQWRHDVSYGSGYPGADAWLAGFEHGVDHAEIGRIRSRELGVWF